MEIPSIKRSPIIYACAYIRDWSFSGRYSFQSSTNGLKHGATCVPLIIVTKKLPWLQQIRDQTGLCFFNVTSYRFRRVLYLKVSRKAFDFMKKTCCNLLCIDCVSETKVLRHDNVCVWYFNINSILIRTRARRCPSQILLYIQEYTSKDITIAVSVLHRYITYILYICTIVYVMYMHFIKKCWLKL